MNNACTKKKNAVANKGAWKSDNLRSNKAVLNGMDPDVYDDHVDDLVNYHGFNLGKAVAFVNEICKENARNERSKNNV